MRKKRQLLAVLLATTTFRCTLAQAASFGPPHTPQPFLSDSKKLLSFSCGCQDGDVFHGREKRQKQDKKGKEARCNLPRISPTPARELQFNLFMFRMSELGCTRGCSDFSPREERPCARGNQHSECQPCPSFTFTGISWYWILYSSQLRVFRGARAFSLKSVFFVPPEK